VKVRNSLNDPPSLNVGGSSLRVIIHRGSHQIGGSCVEIASDSTRLILDAGLPLESSGPVVLPPVPGLFGEGPHVDAILLSHSHPDHSGLLDQTKPEIPFYLTRGTSKMLMAGEIFAKGSKLPRARQRAVNFRQRVEIGDFAVTPHAVDHSVFGAVAWLVEHPSGRILYSGDLRMDGRKTGMAQDLVKALSGKPVDALLLEGTHFSESGRSRCVGERQLEKEIGRLVRSSPGLVLAMFSPQNLDRLVTFYKAARHAGRVFVVDLYGAFVMNLLRSEVRIPPPSAKAGIRVFFPTYRPRNIGKIEHQVESARISLDEVIATPDRFVMLARTTMLEPEFGGRLPAGTRALYSMWSGYRSQPRFVKFERALGEAGGDMIECHTSGHASVEDLVDFVRQLQPKRVIPMHTTRPEAMRLYFAQTEIVNDGEIIEI